MSGLNTIIRRCCAIVRDEIKRENEFYKRFVPVLDKVVAEDLTVKEWDVQQMQVDRRRDLWEVGFKGYNKKLKNLLEILNENIEEEKKDATT